LLEGPVSAPASGGSGLTPDGGRMLRAIREPPEEVREVLDLERIQRLAQTEAAEVLGVRAAKE
jgi:hypothetical protein